MTAPPHDPEPPKCVLLERSNRACFGEVKPHEGKSYCALHHPAGDRSDEFVRAFFQKIKNRDFNFARIYAPVALVIDDEEWDGEVDFSHAVFTQDVFFDNKFPRNAKFYNTKFRGYFGARTTFDGEADFRVCEFSTTANFVESRFNGPVTFLAAQFGGPARFDGVVFDSSTIFGCTFRDSVDFSSNDPDNAFSLQQKVSFDAVRFDKPELVVLSDITLRPWWFIGGSPTKILFENIKWENELEDEINRVQERYGALGFARLATAYRELAVNSEDAHRYREASDFRYSSMETQRRAKNRGLAFWTLHWWYWIASGYGERIGRAATALVALWFLFALAYMYVGFARTDVQVISATPQVIAVLPADEVGRPLRPSKALMYSLGVLSLQKPEPQTVTDAAAFLVIVESVLGPLQAALLILAIRRKFMR